MMKEEAAIKQPCSSMALKWAELKQHYFTDCVRPPRRLGGTASEHAATCGNATTARKHSAVLIS